MTTIENKKRKPAINSTFGIGGVSYSASTFAVRIPPAKIPKPLNNLDKDP